MLAFEWPGEGALWRAERQTVIRVDRPALSDLTERVLGQRRNPGDPGGRPAVVTPATPRGPGPVRLNLPFSAPALPVSHDDAGWCLASGASVHSPAALVPA